MKLILAYHEGRFALTLDEWKSGNNYDFLGITLHFHDEDFEFRKYVIGFEVLDPAVSYTSDVLYQHLNLVLQDYNIKDRIVSITRDNASPITLMITKFKDSLETDSRSSDAFEDSGDLLGEAFEFSGDIRCAGHILNLATNSFLSYTFFKTDKSVAFTESINSISRRYPEKSESFDFMREVPNIVNSIIRGTRKHNFLKNKFRELVQLRKSREGKKTGPEILLRCNDTRWLSVHTMLKRFLHFRPEITKLLQIVGMKTESQRKQYNLRSLCIDDRIWEYLSLIVSILDTFLDATFDLQHDTIETAQNTIPHICGIKEDLEMWRSERIAQENPLIALGLDNALEKLLHYYPICDTNIEPFKDLYLATILDPRSKTKIFEKMRIPRAVATAAENYFYDVFDRYKKELDKKSGSKIRTGAKRKHFSENTGAKKRVRYHESVPEQCDNDDQDPQLEAKNFLAQEVAPCNMSIKEFYRCNRTSMPIIYRMAKDYLSIMAMSASSESLFSKVKDIVTDKRNRLLPISIKKLALLKGRDLVGDDVNSYVEKLEDLEVERKDFFEQLGTPLSTWGQNSGLASQLENRNILTMLKANASREAPHSSSVVEVPEEGSDSETPRSLLPQDTEEIDYCESPDVSIIAQSSENTAELNEDFSIAQSSEDLGIDGIWNIDD